MTDTVKMRPEIDYTITPLSLQTTLATRPIRPATVTYWEFNRPLPFYLKAGMGYRSIRCWISMLRARTPDGYVVGYVNHEGAIPRSERLRRQEQFDADAQPYRRRCGKYFGRHVLEGDLSYENRIYHRYGMYLAPDFSADAVPGSMADYGDANIAVRFGDDFQDLSRVNFEIAIRAACFSTIPSGRTITTRPPDHTGNPCEDRPRFRASPPGCRGGLRAPCGTEGPRRI